MSNTRRLRDLGLSIGSHPTGPSNTIVDVPGVRVGHGDIRGQSPAGKPIHTGVTAIVPGRGNLYTDPLPAAADIFNGYGKSAGLVQIQELGQLESPIFLCSTLNVGKVWDAVAGIILEQNPAAITVNPAVFECNDARFSDSRGRPVEAAHVRSAYGAASDLPPPLGGVGAGSGTTAFGYKGGLGSASRVVTTKAFGPVRVGVLSYNNFGGRLTWRGRELPPPGAGGEHGGSVIVVLATDAPLGPNVLRRLARRAWGGIARTGSGFNHGSGDIALAFALPSPEGPCPDRLTWRLPASDADALFGAVADATEESVWDAMLLAEDTVGVDGKTCPALRPEALLAAAGDGTQRQK